MAVRDLRRLAEVDRYGLPDLLGHPPRRDLLGLARLAARVCGASMSMITYIDQTHLRTLATVGFAAGEVPRAVSLCSLALHDSDPFIVDDLAADPRYAESLVATTYAARFYASQQLLAPSGEPIGSLCVFDTEPRTLDQGQREALRDLAERVVDALELELRTRELTRVVGELRRSNEALAAFAGQVSHDLRNPLASLSGHLDLAEELLGDEQPDLDRVRPLLRRTHRSADRMAQLIGDVLNLAEVGGELHLDDVDADVLVAEAVEDLGADLAEADLHVDPLGWVVADPVQLRLVVQNLLSNAVKYAVPGERASVSITTTTRPGWWRLLVSDHGRGISAGDRHRIFEPFTRLDTSVPGTGVGLATCERVARAHGGRMGVDDTAGGGATVWFEIPTHGSTSS